MLLEHIIRRAVALDTIDTMRKQAIAAAQTSSDGGAVACAINIAVSAMQVVLEEAKKEDVVSAIEGASATACGVLAHDTAVLYSRKPLATPYVTNALFL